MNYELANSIVDTAIIYTEAMFIYTLFACLILHIDKRLSTQERFSDKWLDKIIEEEVPRALLPQAKEISFNVVPFTRKQQRYQSYWSTMTCKQMRSYLKDLGYTKLQKLRKAELIEICEVA